MRSPHLLDFFSKTKIIELQPENYVSMCPNLKYSSTKVTSTSKIVLFVGHLGIQVDMLNFPWIKIGYGRFTLSAPIKNVKPLS